MTENSLTLRTVTLVGSKRFRSTFDEVAKELSLSGIIVHTPAIFLVDDTKLTEKEHQVLDDLHRAKMKMSDEVVVINVDGYIGKDTAAEIKWAEGNGIKVSYLYAHNDDENITTEPDTSTNSSISYGDELRAEANRIVQNIIYKNPKNKSGGAYMLPMGDATYCIVREEINRELHELEINGHIWASRSFSTIRISEELSLAVLSILAERFDVANGTFYVYQNNFFLGIARYDSSKVIIGPSTDDPNILYIGSGVNFIPEEDCLSD